MMSAADAPSVRKEELAAVWVPCGLMKAGLREPSFSMVESPLMPLSIVSPNVGTISCWILPSAWALAAFWWERRAKASCSSRVTPKRAANLSLLCPITSPVENWWVGVGVHVCEREGAVAAGCVEEAAVGVTSAIAGASGARKEGRNCLRSCSRALLLRARLSCISQARAFLGNRMGTSLIVSAPPAITVLA